MRVIETFVPPYPLKTPVLFLIFKRLATTKQVFEQIRKAKPPRLYIAADGPRENVPEEAEEVKAVREYVLSNIDWECEVNTLFREKNLGCGKAVSEAITWFFENEEMGIILEDDTLPSLSFFWFCEILLEKYKEDLRIWHISGNNFHFGWKRDKDYSYYFGGIYGSIWGWATWKNRWQHYDINMKNYEELYAKKYLENCYDRSKAVRSRLKEFDKVKRGLLDTWDIQWVYTRWINSGLTIIPIVNLVQNIGFGEEAVHTHSTNDKRADMIAYEIDLKLKHPPFVIRDAVSEQKFYNDFVKQTFLRKFKKMVKKIIVEK